MSETNRADGSGRRGGSRRRRRAIATTSAALAAALVIAGATPALAAPGDRAEAEGLFLSGSGGAVNIDALATLQAPYNAFPPGGSSRQALDVTALGLLDLGLGVQLFGGSDVVELGAVDQYARTDATGAFASSGLLAADGAIAAGTGAPGENTTVDLTPVLSALDATDLLSSASLELGALAAEASATRTTTGATIDSDYQIASGDLILQSPALAALYAGLTTEVADLDAAVDALDVDASGLLGVVTGTLDDLLAGAVVLGTPTVDVDVDLGAALAAAAATPLTADGVTIVLSTGTIILDLEELQGLNGLDPNTVLLSDAAVISAIDATIDGLLTGVLPTTLQNALNAASLDIEVATSLTVAGVPLGELVIDVDGTVGGFLDLPGAAEPEASVDAPGLPAVVDLDLLLDPLEDYVTATLVPAVGAVLEPALNPAAFEAYLDSTTSGAVTALAPLLGAVNEVVEITVNVQENPGTFRNAAGTDAGSFTQRAVQLRIAPDLGPSVITLRLASATVRAVALAPPAGLAIDPPRGPVTGGTPVTITGTGLSGVTDVTFGGVPGTELLVNSDTSLTVVTPAGAAPGVVTVAVTGPDGTNTSLVFEYYPVTAVTAIAPDSGTTEGGTEVTITGVCLTGATEVLFDGVAGTDLDVVSDTQLTVTAPPGTAGLVDVTIVNPTECGNATVQDGFTYVNPGAPTIMGIDPDRGPETGGTTVEITGIDFTGTTAVTFDGIPATEFEVISDTLIRAVSPPHAPGGVDVIVTNAAGDSAGFDFEYFAVADISSVSPDAGPVAGGTTVTITGACFLGATAVEFDGIAATSFTVVNDTTITAVVPAGAGEGAVDVTVVGAGDCGTAEAPDAFEYFLPPVVTDLDPAQGPETGGTPVTIIGSGFAGTTDVTFDGISAGTVEVVSDTEIRVVAPPHAPGPVTVTVVHPGGDVDAGDFLYLNVPSIASLTPDQGPEDGGTVVVITGEGFTGATGVTFDGAAGTTFTVDSDTQITVTSPAHVPGNAAVVVTHPNGDAPPLSFAYIEGTEVDAVTPPGGPFAGGNTVVITGVCFTGATDVSFGGVPATSFTVDSDTQITATVPAGTGIVDVTVEGAVACGTDTLPDAYEYTDDPVIGTIDPAAGPETGGTVVTITGSNFTGVTGVTFDGVAGTGLVVVSDTELRITAPAGTPGTADVVVTGPAGSSDAGVFTYTPVTAVDAVTPGSGPTGGGTTVTITGSCFTGAPAVLFGGTASPRFTVVSDTEIRATAPARAATGAVPVSVVGGGTCGTGSLAGGFSYFPGAAVLPATGAEAPVALAGIALLLLGGGAALRLLRRRTA